MKNYQDNHGDSVGKTTKQEYLDALESAEDEGYQDDNSEAEGNLSEAERLALHADAPPRRMDGNIVGSTTPRPRALTVSQMLFAQGVIQGKTYRQAYRDAYPNAQGSGESITSSAYKLMQDSRIQKMVNDAWEQTADVLVEDVVASKRYILKQLVTHSKDAQTKTSEKLKALELLGKAVGLFKHEESGKGEQATPEQLKRDLAVHLRLLDNVKPIKAA
jgi:hypothetical protein